MNPTGDQALARWEGEGGRVIAAGQRTSGIHHVSAICGDPQQNVDFYTDLLGLRLVKVTVNFDDPTSYHLYYGNDLGEPGTVMTFFAWILPPMVTSRARQGSGQIVATSFAIPEGSVGYWVDRLAAGAVEFDGPTARLDEQVIALLDPDGVPIELVTRPDDALRAGRAEGAVPTEHAIRGLHGVTLCVDGYQRTAQLLTATLGLSPSGSEGSRFRFRAGEGASSAEIDLVCRPEGEKGRMGIGGVHHVAWRTPSPESQVAWRSTLASAGFDVTPVLDRWYFRSIYFREPGGVLFEIATDLPGFAVDEAPEALGTELKLPPWLEARRPRIEAVLPSLRLPTGADLR